MYQVKFSEHAVKELKKLDKPTARVIKNWIIKKLSGYYGSTSARQAPYRESERNMAVPGRGLPTFCGNPGGCADCVSF